MPNKGIKLAVVGSRTFTDYELLNKTLKEIDSKTRISAIVSGGAVGADSFGNQWAKENGRPILIYYPEWYKNGKYDKGAGFKRNIKICKSCDCMVAFTNGSKGTAHSIETAQNLGKKVKIIQFMEPQIFNAWVDGSFIDNKVKWAVIIKDDKNNIVFQKSGIIENEEAQKMRQVTGELRATMVAVAWARNCQDKVIINYDYEGIYRWVSDAFNEDNWNANNRFTKSYREYIMKNLTYIDKFVKVKAHSGILENEEVDKLAKNAK